MTYDITKESEDLAEFQAGRRRVFSQLPGSFEKAWNVFTYSSGYITTIAIAQVIVALVLLSIPLNLSVIVVGLVTFSVYTHDRIRDVETDAVTSPRRSAFIRRHSDVLYVLASVAYGLAVALAVFGGPVALAIALVPGTFWILYASEWVPDVGIPFDRLKEVLVVNTTVVALGWAVMVTFLPYAYADVSISPLVGLVFAYFFLRSFVTTEMANVSDMEGDRAIGVATIPSTFGVPRTRRALHGLDLLRLWLVVAAVLIGYVSIIPTVVLVGGITYSLGVTTFLGRTEDLDILEFATESEYLAVAAAMVPILIGI